MCLNFIFSILNYISSIISTLFKKYVKMYLCVTREGLHVLIICVSISKDSRLTDPYLVQ